MCLYRAGKLDLFAFAVRKVSLTKGGQMNGA